MPIRASLVTTSRSRRRSNATRRLATVATLAGGFAATCLDGAAALAIAWHWTEADRLVLCLPLFHMHGVGVGLRLLPVRDDERQLAREAIGVGVRLGAGTDPVRLIDRGERRVLSHHEASSMTSAAWPQYRQTARLRLYLRASSAS